MLVLYLLAAFLFTKIHFQSTNESPRAGLASLVNGEAHKPFQCRILIPLAARSMSALLSWDVRHSYRVIEFLVVALLLVSYRAHLLRFFGARTSTFFSLLLLYPMLWNHCGLAKQYFPSEIPAILLFVLGVNCILARRVALLYLVFVLGCLNQETALLLALACLAVKPEEETWTRALCRVAGLAALWVYVRACLATWFVDNRGPTLWELHYASNLEFLRDLVCLSPYVLRHFLVFGGAWLSIPFVWHRLPKAVRGLVLLAVPYFLVAVAVGRLMHGGSYTELTPAILTASLYWLREGMRRWGLGRERPSEESYASVSQREARRPCLPAWLVRLAPTLPRAMDHCRALLARVRSCSWHWWIVCVLAAYFCVRVHERSTVEFMDRTRMAFATGSAEKVVQYRVLVPFLARQMWVGIGLPLRTAYNGINTLAIMALLLAYRAYLGSFVGRRASYALCFVIVAPVIFNYCALNRLYYPPDFASITFFVVGALCIQHARWRTYYLVFVLATLNRETSCFLTFLLLFTQWGRVGRRAIALHCVAQFAIWAVLKAMLAWIFRNNAGPVLAELQLRCTVSCLMRLLSLDPNALQYVLVFGLAWVTIPLVWDDLPPFPKRSLLVTIPFLLGMSIVGNIFEVRIYNELVPIVTTPAAIWLHARHLKCAES